MPIDRRLAYEILKWFDPEVYRMYCRLRYRGMTTEEIKNDSKTFYKLNMMESAHDKLDSLEAEGYIEILNDYENEAIYIKKNKVIE